MHPKNHLNFHGFYYGPNPVHEDETSKLYKLPLTVEQASFFEEITAQPFQSISQEKYWRSFHRFLQTHAPQGYIAWKSNVYWIILLPKVNSAHRYVKDTIGLHIVKISKGRFAHKWIKCPKDTDSDLYENITNLVYTPWDWQMDGDGRERQSPLSASEKKKLEENISWTNALHTRMRKKFGRTI